VIGLEHHKLKLEALFRKGKLLSDWMGAEGSSGTPYFKKVILQKQQQNMKQGVRIEGLNNTMQNSRKKKDKTPMMSDKTENSTEVRNTEK